MPQLNAYLNFTGNCRDAMSFYQQCLGGELKMMTFGESPMGAQLPAESQQSIMHAQLVTSDFTMMASDSMQGPVINGNSVNLSLNCNSEAEIDGLFAAIAEGGQVTMPLADQFWGAKFGMLTDKFGINWMMNFERAPQA
ncbi:VOC family protein [Hymenobacter sp. BT770]|uniref:VOC family protein n=1 Tax=Hymenobacter sp. BT770 TaxID=2886942 RepID=UPI001D0F55C9|nr:VOC family protein [Hymenobacter sp. BT770]MCC3155097.1 VOC family protein [Hymenobacter sp. BT770]MDO3417040.1 VOC family protein [Hymenobacter sp. BT770]